MPPAPIQYVNFQCKSRPTPRCWRRRTNDLMKRHYNTCSHCAETNHCSLAHFYWPLQKPRRSVVPAIHMWCAAMAATNGFDLTKKPFLSIHSPAPVGATHFQPPIRSFVIRCTSHEISAFMSILFLKTSYAMRPMPYTLSTSQTPDDKSFTFSDRSYISAHGKSYHSHHRSNNINKV